MSAETKWFIAEAVFEATIPNNSDPSWEPLLENLLFLVRDVDEASALSKAGRIAKEKEHSYENSEGQRVVWSFLKLLEVTETVDQQFGDGAEIKSTMSGGETHQAGEGARRG